MLGTYYFYLYGLNQMLVEGRAKKKKKTHPTENNICEAVSLVTSSTLIRTEDYEKMLLVASFCVASAILPYK